MSESKKVYDAFGNEIPDGLREEGMEIVRLLVSRDEIEGIVKHKHEQYEKTQLSRSGEFLDAMAFVQSARALLKVTTKEKARQALFDSVYEFAFKELRAASEKRGMPKDIESYLKYEMAGLGRCPFIPPWEVKELTKKRAVYGIQICPFADHLRFIRENYPDYCTQDVLDVASGRCQALDIGRIQGWNPDFKFERTHWKCDDLIGKPPSEGCYFKIEVPDE